MQMSPRGVFTRPSPAYLKDKQHLPFNQYIYENPCAVPAVIVRGGQQRARGVPPAHKTAPRLNPNLKNARLRHWMRYQKFRASLHAPEKSPSDRRKAVSAKSIAWR